MWKTLPVSRRWMVQRPWTPLSTSRPLRRPHPLQRRLQSQLHNFSFASVKAPVEIGSDRQSQLNLRAGAPAGALSLLSIRKLLTPKRIRAIVSLTSQVFRLAFEPANFRIRPAQPGRISLSDLAVTCAFPSRSRFRKGAFSDAMQNIKHVFVLMLENRSLDHMLGFSGLTGKDAVSGQQ